MKVYPVFLHRAKHAAKEVAETMGFCRRSLETGLAVSATGGYSEAVSGKCPGFHATTWLEIG